MANGRVITGFSMPRVALYSESGGSITYTSGTALARGVNVQITPNDAGDDNIFYADNQAAERVAGTFTGATLTLTVDGLLDAARKLIMGLATATAETVGTESVDIYNFDDDQVIPYVGIGFVVRYMQDNVTTYVPVVLPKCRFDQINDNAATQEADISWQTQELTATVLRADDAKHCWKRIGEEQTTEAKATAVITTIMG